MEQANFKPDTITTAEHLLEFQDEFFDLLAVGIGVTYFLGCECSHINSLRSQLLFKEKR